MKQQAYEILKTAIVEHREQLLSGRQMCLGLLRDYGGREHPEVNLFADAVEENIPDRLLRSQPVTQQIIDSLAGDFASNRLYDGQAAKFVVSSWADALGLLTLEPPILTNSRPFAGPDPESSANKPAQAVERSWHYQDGTNTIGPLPESQLMALCMSGRLQADSLIWSEGMSEWDKASTYFVIPATLPYSSGKQEPAVPNSAVRPVASTAISPDGGHPTTKKYGGIRRTPYNLGILGALIVGGMVSRGSDTGMILTTIIFFPLGILRLKNIGTSAWWILLAFVPIGNFLLGLRLMFYPEGFEETKKLDTAAKTSIYIILGFVVILIFIAAMN